MTVRMVRLIPAEPDEVIRGRLSHPPTSYHRVLSGESVRLREAASSEVHVEEDCSTDSVRIMQ